MWTLHRVQNSQSGRVDVSCLGCATRLDYQHRASCSKNDPAPCSTLREPQRPCQARATTRTLHWAHHVTQGWPQEGMQRAQQLHCCCACGAVGVAQPLLGPVDEALDVERRQQEVRHRCLDPVQGLRQHLRGTAQHSTACYSNGHAPAQHGTRTSTAHSLNS